MSEMNDNQALDILFDCNGVDFVIKSIESSIQDLSRNRQAKIKQDLLILRCYLMDIRRVVNTIKPDNFPDELITSHAEEKSKTLVADMRKLIETPIRIKP